MLNLITLAYINIELWHPLCMCAPFWRLGTSRFFWTTTQVRKWRPEVMHENWLDEMLGKRMVPDRKAWRTSRMGAQACFKHREHLGCFCENWALLFFLFSSAGVPLHKQLHPFSSEISWVSKSTRPKSRFKGSYHSASQWPFFVRQSRLAVFLADQRNPETLQDRNMTILECSKIELLNWILHLWCSIFCGKLNPTLWIVLWVTWKFQILGDLQLFLAEIFALRFQLQLHHHQKIQ